MSDTGAAAGTSAGAAARARHPLDPLTADELRRAAGAALALVGGGDHLRVVDVSLHEPDKTAVHAPDAAGRVPREGWVVLLDRLRASTHEIVVALDDDDTVVSARELPGVQAAITPSEWEECERAVRADPAFAQALARRGVTDLGLVTIEAWGMGTHADAEHR